MARLQSFLQSRGRRARSAQKKHWELMLSGKFGADYTASTERIGRTHARMNLPLDMYMSAYAGAASHLLEILIRKTSGGLFRRGRGRTTEMAGAMGILSELAGKVTDATGQLSTRTVSQAAALEETAAAMNQMTASVASSSEKTQQTNQVGQKAQGDVKLGADVITQAAQAMESIQKFSDAISQITGMIDDVAFQTNLLAPNAGVEAARAGEAGRGFAVVASEVRALAVRSSDAAREIKKLIKASEHSVGEGVQLIQRADTTFAGIVTSFASVTELASAVAVASREQSQGLDEINGSINELDRITQMNAGMVEETIRAMETMRSQADELQSLVGQLRFAPAATYDNQIAAA